MRQLRELRPQVVHCHDLDTLWLGRRAARRFGAKLVFDAHENFPDMMAGHLPGLMVRALRRHERRLVRRADLVITVGERLCEHYRQLGARAAAVVGNWKDADAYRFPPQETASLRQSLGVRPGQIAIGFIANLGRDRQLEPLLQAVAGDGRFACVVGGRGLQEDLAPQYAHQHANIIYLGPVSPPRVAAITAACDALYYGLDVTNPNLQWSAPNKLYEALAAGKAIIAGDFGEVGQTVRESGCGILANTSTAAGVLAALEQLAQPGAIERLGQAAKSLQMKYSARAAIEALLVAYEGLEPG
jgi:glycosyltransferase involved in cell wall biosynthesis